MILLFSMKARFQIKLKKGKRNVTLKDFMKRVDVENEETQQKMLLFRDNKQCGWTNIRLLRETDNSIELTFDSGSPFSDDN